MCDAKLSRAMARLATAEDLESLLAITHAAFGEEELRPLVRRLLGHGDVTALITDSSGYIFCTECRVSGQMVALLGPLAVAPEVQRQGLGSALVRRAMEVMCERGCVAMLVLGDPNYYGRFGFEVTKVRAPYDLPADHEAAWREVHLAEDVKLEGTLVVPEPWQDAALWG